MKFLFRLCAITCTLLMSCAYAFPLNTFYLGINTGILQGHFNNTYLDQTDLIPQNITQSVMQYAYTAGLNFGLTHLINESYTIGAELSANIDSHRASFQSGASSTAFSDVTQINRHYDLTFIPSLLVTPSISIYLKAGPTLASLQDNVTSPAGFTPVMTNYSTNKNVIGFVAGMGIKKYVSEHVALFAEAKYRDYGTVSFSNFQNFTAEYTHTTHLYTYDAVIGALYSFF